MDAESGNVVTQAEPNEAAVSRFDARHRVEEVKESCDDGRKHCVSGARIGDHTDIKHAEMRIAVCKQ